jgi:hypothetical protein
MYPDPGVVAGAADLAAGQAAELVLTCGEF